MQERLVKVMVHMSLPERLPIIRQLFNLLKLAKSTFRNIYRQIGIDLGDLNSNIEQNMK